MHGRVRAAVRFPMAGKDWPRKVILGGAISLLLELLFVGLAYVLSEEAAFGVAPLVVALNLPVWGYILRVYGDTLRWEAGTLPEWQDWFALLRRGLLGFLIFLT